MERLRVRYVIKYRPTIDSTDGIPRTVRIEVGDSRSGGPLQVVMASGRTVRARIVAEERYTPSFTPDSG